MSNAASVLESAEVVEVLDWVDPSSLSGVVSDFARIHILFSLFDGDPDKWLSMIAANGTASERAHDAPFLHDLKRRFAADPMLPGRLRRVVGDFVQLMALPIE